MKKEEKTIDGVKNLGGGRGESRVQVRGSGTEQGSLFIGKKGRRKGEYRFQWVAGSVAGS